MNKDNSISLTYTLEWYPVKGFENYFEITKSGIVKSKSRQQFNGQGYFMSKSKILKYSKAWDKYLAVTLCIDGKRFKKRIHRLVAATFIPNPLNLSQVNHKDGNKLNNFVNNLEWCTGEENMKHAHTTGLYDNIKKVNLKLINTIQKEYEENIITQEELANKYKLSLVTIQKILSNRHPKCIGNIKNNRAIGNRHKNKINKFKKL